MFFILRKDYTAKERREILSGLCTIFDVEGIDKAKLLSGLANEEFSDFEDCLQMECAKSYGADYIVTRNVSDYSVPDIKARFICQSTTILRNLRQRVQVFALFW